MKYAKIANGMVADVIVADAAFIAAVTDTYVQTDIAGIGWTYANGVFTPPVAPVDPVPAPVDPTQWLIDHGSLLDRFGVSVKLQFLESTIPRVVALRQDFYGRKWLDLKNQELRGGFYFMAGVTVPLLGTISTPITGLTPELVDTVFTTPVDPQDNLALRKLYFS